MKNPYTPSANDMEYLDSLNEKLSLLCGVSGNEDDVCEFIKGELFEIGSPFKTDRQKNITVNIEGIENKKIMISAHMDEVGFMINKIGDMGELYFSCIGGISPSVLLGKPVTVLGKKRLGGIISCKPYHLEKKDERGLPPSLSELYIDIGVNKKEDADAIVLLGDYAAFDSDFIKLGDNKIKGKALDDRIGCAIMLTMIRHIKEQNILPSQNLVFAFTSKEEIGYSGAGAVAYSENPDMALVLETTAIADLDGVPEKSRVAIQGQGAAVSFIDRSSVYLKAYFDEAMKLAADNGIAVQTKHYVSGGNDAAHIGRTGNGIPVLTISVPTRYLHSPACIADKRDIYSAYSLLSAFIFKEV